MFEGYGPSRFGQIALWSVAVATLVFLIVPSLIVIPLSFSGSSLLEFPPRSLSLRWYAEFFGSFTWMSALRVSLELAALTAIVSVCLGFLTAYGLSKMGGRAAAIIKALTLAPAIIPGILLAIGLFFVLARVGMLGTLPGLLLGHTVVALPVVLIVLAPAFARFDWAQERAARSLGASWLTTSWQIVLPQMRFSLLTAGLLAFLTSLDEAVISIFVGSGENTTLTKIMFLALRDKVDPTIAAISTLWIVLVTAVVFALNLRRER
jgi:putative spermidine/putrescine transport system permease protein